MVDEWSELLRVSQRLRRLHSQADARRRGDDATETIYQIEHAHGILMQMMKRFTDALALID
jgi:hypothetical protein